MTILSNRVFSGFVPRAPADKLPELNAQKAENCNFAYQELRPTKGGFLLTTLANAAKSIFSLNGLTFASWTYKVKAWKGPVTNDTFNRFYFSSLTGGLRVSQTTFLTTSGGEPAVSYRVGVPAVAAAPTYKLVDRNTLVDYPNAVVKLYSYYEANGARFNETPISSFTTISPFRSFSFNAAEPTSSVAAPSTISATNRTVAVSQFIYNLSISDDTGVYSKATTVDTGGGSIVIVDSSTLTYNGVTYNNVVSISPVNGGTITPGGFLDGLTGQTGAATPSSATLSVRIDVVDSVKNTTIFSLSASSGVASQTSNAIPGGVEATLVKNGTAAGQWRVDLTYGVIETRAYVFTMVNDWNEESKPSPPVLVSPTYMQGVQLTFVAPSFTGYVNCSRYRPYRSTTSGDYLSVTTSPATFSGSGATFQDDLTAIVNTDAVLTTTTWDLPPTNLQGLTLLPNGYFAAFAGDTMYFSEPYAPWAWPYAMTFPVPLVGIRAIESSMVVTTNSFPYVVTGVHPESLTQNPLTTSQAGVSDYGMCVVQNTVVYVSNDGLVLVRGLEVDLSFSQKFWTRADWRTQFGAVLGQLELAYHDGSLVCGCPTAGNMFEIRLDSEGGGNLTTLDNTQRSDCLYVLPASDQLYYTNGNQLIQYKGGSDLVYDWWGRDNILAKPINFGAGYINTNGPVTLTIYAGTKQWLQQTFTGPGYFRIPSGEKHLRWSYRLQGSGYIKEISIAETMQELVNV